MSNTDWKEKYLSTLDRFEGLQKEDQDRIDLLCKGLVRVSLAADGQQAILDEKLASLRQAIRKNDEILDLKPLIADLEKSVVALDSQRRDQSNSLEKSITQSLDQLATFNLPRAITSKIRKYKKNLSDLIADTSKPAALWKPYIDIQVSVADYWKISSDGNADKPGFLKRLFGGDDGNATESPDTGQQPHDLNTLDDNVASREHATQGIQEAQELYNSGEPIDETEREQLRQRIASVLSGLLKKIDLHGEENVARNKLIRRIQSNFSWEELPEILEASAELIASTREVAQQEFEGFLVALHERLQDVQSFLTAAREGEVTAQVNQQKLDSDVRRELHDLGKTVAERNDIETIKLDIETMVTRIVSAVDDFHSAEKERRDEVYAHIEQLGQQMSRMEDETSSLKESLDDARRNAMSDALTELPNRKAYDEYISREFTRWKRHNAPLSIAVCDIDHFKSINDNLGHLRGDKVLKLVARELSRKVRNEDFVARFGGEEFVVVMPNTDEDSAVVAVDKARKSIEQCPFNFNNEPITVTASFGVAQFQKDDTLESCFERADKAVYRAKKNGRNRVERSE